MDLRWQVDELSRNLQQAFPDMPWGQRINFTGDDPLQFGEVPSMLSTLAVYSSSGRNASMLIAMKA